MRSPWHLEGITDRREIPERLAAWEERERPLAEHCQRWPCLYGEVSILPDAVRARVVGSAMADQWVRGEILRAARRMPAGTRVAI